MNISRFVASQFSENLRPRADCPHFHLDNHAIQRRIAGNPSFLPSEITLSVKANSHRSIRSKIVSSEVLTCS